MSAKAVMCFKMECLLICLLTEILPVVPKKVHKFQIIYLCSENRQIAKFYVIC